MHWKLGVNTVKTLKFENDGGVRPPSSYGGDAPGIKSRNRCRETERGGDFILDSRWLKGQMQKRGGPK